jgi:integrase/recombinase XerC
MTTIKNPKLAALIATKRPGAVTFAPDLLALYLNHMQVRALSPKHIEHCQQQLRACQTVVGKTLGEMTRQDLQGFDAHLAARKAAGTLKASTWRKYQTACRVFFTWAAGEEHIPVNPATHAFVTPKLEKRLPIHLEEAEVLALLAAAQRQRCGERDAALIAVLYFAGLRISEALGLDWEHLRQTPDGGYLTVIGKGDKERRVPIAPGLVPYLDAWRAVHPNGGTGAIFTNRLRPRQRMKYDADWRKHIKVILAAAGLDVKKLSSHKLRHTFATTLIRKQMRVEHIQKLLGHSDISTTMIYAHAWLDAQAKAEMGQALALPDAPSPATGPAS